MTRKKRAKPVRAHKVRSKTNSADTGSKSVSDTAAEVVLSQPPTGASSDSKPAAAATTPSRPAADPDLSKEFTVDLNEILTGIRIKDSSKSIPTTVPTPVTPQGHKAQTVTDILNSPSTPPTLIIEDLIDEGLNLVAGTKHAGKSIFSLDIGTAIATGSKALGFFYVARPGEVLILAKEDHLTRIKERLTARGEKEIDTLKFLPQEISYPRHFNDGGMDDLEQWMKDNPKTICIMIDTLDKFIRTTSSYSNVYDDMGKLQKFALDHHIAVVVFHHTTKAQRKDPFDAILGTRGVTAAADGMSVIERLDDNDAILHVRGRGIQDAHWNITRKDFSWEVIGAVDSSRLFRCKTAERQEIWEVLDGTKPMKSKDILKALAKKGVVKKPEAIRFLLTKMLKDGEINRTKKGEYVSVLAC